MSNLIVQIIIGLIIIIIGILNIKGNISLLHSYHRKRVKKEDIKPFGKKVGIGSIIIGITEILASIFTYFNYINISNISNISNIILCIGQLMGFIIIFSAMIKYNKGIF